MGAVASIEALREAEALKVGIQVKYPKEFNEMAKIIHIMIRKCGYKSTGKLLIGRATPETLKGVPSCDRKF